MAEFLTATQQAEYTKAFKLFDVTGSGTTCVAELQSVFKSLGRPYTEEELRQMIAKLDVDRSGVVDIKEFLDMLGRREKDVNEVRKAFAVFDKDGDGFITFKELKQAMKELDERVTDEELREMIAEADPIGRGMVDFDGLVRMMAC